PNSRYRNTDKKVQQTQIKENDNKVASSNLSNEKEVENIDKKENHQIFSLVSSNTEEEVDVDDIEVDNNEDSDLKEMKVQIIIKIVQKTLRKKIISKDYIVSYKVVNTCEPLNKLENESDFQEFIGEYKRVVLSGKKILMIVIIRDKLTKKKNHTSSDESGFSSAEELQGKKKKKSHTICEDDLTKEKK
ncbi:hypothetical protein C1646_762326, partial [Rhizophagus diaphanus]